LFLRLSGNLSRSTSRFTSIVERQDDSSQLYRSFDDTAATTAKHTIGYSSMMSVGKGSEEEEEGGGGGEIDEEHQQPAEIEPSRSFEKAREKVPAASAGKRPTKKKPKDKPKRCVASSADVSLQFLALFLLVHRPPSHLFLPFCSPSYP
jgi:hypothetical protein